MNTFDVVFCIDSRYTVCGAFQFVAGSDSTLVTRFYALVFENLHIESKKHCHITHSRFYPLSTFSYALSPLYSPIRLLL